MHGADLTSKFKSLLSIATNSNYCCFVPCSGTVIHSSLYVQYTSTYPVHARVCVCKGRLKCTQVFWVCCFLGCLCLLLSSHLFLATVFSLFLLFILFPCFSLLLCFVSPELALVLSSWHPSHMLYEHMSCTPWFCSNYLHRKADFISIIVRAYAVWSTGQTTFWQSFSSTFIFLFPFVLCSYLSFLVLCCWLCTMFLVRIVLTHGASAAGVRVPLPVCAQQLSCSNLHMKLICFVALLAMLRGRGRKCWNTIRRQLSSFLNSW